jgi:hypothetical protein
VAATADLVHEKLDQAVDILGEQEVDLWLTLVRETSLTNDPCLDLIAGTYSAWTGAFLVSTTGEKIAIVGRFDAPSVEEVGAYDVIGYDESIRPALQETVERLTPRSIALNYSDSDAAADGLTHGLWRLLSETFADTPYVERFMSSEPSSTPCADASHPPRSSAFATRSARPRRSSRSSRTGCAPVSASSRSPASCRPRSSGAGSDTRGAATTVLPSTRGRRRTSGTRHRATS